MPQIKDYTAVENMSASVLMEAEIPDPEREAGSDATLTRNMSVGALALFLNNQLEYQTELQTSDKTIIGAINEARSTGGGGGSVFTDVTGTLEAGETSITLSNSAIKTTSMLDFYTDVFGVNPTGAAVASGSVTLTFEAQATDIEVKVRVW